MSFDDDPEFRHNINEKTSLIEVVCVIVWKLKERYTIPPTYDTVFEIIRGIVMKYRPELYDEKIFRHLLFLLKEDFLFRDFLLAKKKCSCFR